MTSISAKANNPLEGGVEGYVTYCKGGSISVEIGLRPWPMESFPLYKGDTITKESGRIIVIRTTGEKVPVTFGAV